MLSNGTIFWSYSPHFARPSWSGYSTPCGSSSKICHKYHRGSLTWAMGFIFQDDGDQLDIIKSWMLAVGKIVSSQSRWKACDMCITHKEPAYGILQNPQFAYFCRRNIREASQRLTVLQYFKYTSLIILPSNSLTLVCVLPSALILSTEVYKHRLRQKSPSPKWSVWPLRRGDYSSEVRRRMFERTAQRKATPSSTYILIQPEWV